MATLKFYDQAHMSTQHPNYMQSSLVHWHSGHLFMNNCVIICSRERVFITLKNYTLVYTMKIIWVDRYRNNITHRKLKWRFY